MEYLYLAIAILLSYLYGSIPFELVIGKLFFGIDIREHGSGNLGGTNAGRVLGKPVGLLCIILDASKCFFTVLILNLFKNYLPDYTIYLAALSCMIGHCYPIFANFKGGKAVAAMFGYMLATNVYLFAICLGILLITLKISKYVSLSSILACITMALITPILIESKIAWIVNILMCLLVIYRHRSNIERLRNHTENKVKWL